MHFGRLYFRKAWVKRAAKRAAYRGTTTAGYDAGWVEEQKRFQAQMDDYDRQTKKVDEQAKKADERAQRLDKLLEKWEEHARRQDAILDAKEKQLGIRK